MSEVSSMSEFDQTRQLVKYWRESKALYRPPREALQIYEDHMAKISGRKDAGVLILGVTPELRMLALKNGCRVTAVDNNMIAIKAMDEFMDYTGLDRARETILKYNWLDMPMNKHEYDLALGDGSLTMLTNFEDLENLLARLRELLKPDGYFSTKVGVYPDDWIQTGILDILEKYRQRSKKSLPEFYGPELIFELMFSRDAYDEKNGQMSYAKLIRKLRTSFKEGSLSKSEFDFLHQNWISVFEFWGEIGMDMVLLIPKIGHLESLLAKYFHIISRTDDPYIPHYLLGPKSPR